MIGVSLLTLAPGRMGGSETYVRALMAALARDGEERYVVAVPPDAVDAAGGLPSVVAGGRGSDPRPVALARSLRAKDALVGADVVHYPLTIPAPRVRAPRVLTLHDVLHRDRPELVSRAVKAFRALAYDRAARTSALVVVPSRFVADRAHARIGLDPARARVVPHGVDHTVFRPGAEERLPFLLYPARPWPHKNHALLFEAFAAVRREQPELELILTGGGHADHALPDGVSSLGLVPQARLAELYRTARALVFPSLYEGFGSPLLEAMASGCPVASSDSAALPEVAGDAAVLFDATTAQGIAAGMRAVLEDGAAFAARGLEHAAAYTWKAAALAHEAVYREAAG